MTIEHPQDVLRDLVEVLGDILRIKPEKIDPDRTFPSLGLDSLLVVEFVAVVNRRYGLQARATDLYDYPTPASFAQEIERVRAGAGAPAGPAPAAPAAARHPVGPPAPAPVPAPGRAAPPVSAAATRVADALREQLAAILCCEAWEIDTAVPFNALGMDSMVAAEFIAALNRAFGLQERSVLLYEHPSLAAVAAYVANRTGAAARETAPARAAVRVPVPAAAGRPSAPSRGGVDVLLDALRDDRLTVDEAVALLARG